MSRRKRIHGHRRIKRKSPLLNANVATSALEEMGGKVVKDTSKQAIKKIFGATAGGAVGGALLGKTLYDMYEKGQEESGGRTGYVRNENYDPSKSGPRHGEAGSNAQFIPGGTTVKTHKASIWENKESIF